MYRREERSWRDEPRRDERRREESRWPKGEELETCSPAGDNPDIVLAASPIKLSQTPTTLYQRPPNLGEHNAEVLAEFGIEPP